MEKTGTISYFVSNAMATRCAPQGRTSLRRLLLGGLSSAAIFAAAALPVTIDQNSFFPKFQTAQAASAAAGGNENGGGGGKAKGKGNGNGQGGGNGNGGGMADGGEDHDAGPGGSGGDVAEIDNMSEADFSKATGAIDGNPAIGPADAPVAGIPTIQQIFAMDDSSVLSADQEQSAIENGWGTPPSE